MQGEAMAIQMPAEESCGFGNIYRPLANPDSLLPVRWHIPVVAEEHFGMTVYKADSV